MSDALPLVGGFATATAWSLALGYVFWRSRESFLVPWIVAGALWALRYGLGIADGMGASLPMARILPALAVLRGWVMFWGGRQLLARPLPGWSWPVGTVAILFALVLAEASAASPFWQSAPPYLLLGGGCVYAGVALLGSRRFSSMEGRVAGAAMVAFGVLQASYPLVVRTSWLRAGTSLSSTLQLLMTFGLLLAFLEASLRQRAGVARREQMALTRALAEFLTICAHCKDVRTEVGEDARFVPLGDYVHRHTEASVQLGHCPVCAGE